VKFDRVWPVYCTNIEGWESIGFHARSNYLLEIKMAYFQISCYIHEKLNLSHHNGHVTDACNGWWATIWCLIYCDWFCILDYDVFSRSDFDPNDYANAVLAGEPYPSQPSRPPSQKVTKSTATDLPKEDISLVLTKLNLGIDDVAKQLKTVVRIYTLAVNAKF
jgi:hypothetical protein